MFKWQLATVTVTLEMPLSYSLRGLQKCYFNPWKLKVSIVASLGVLFPLVIHSLPAGPLCFW